MLSAPCVTANTGRNIVKSLNVKKAQAAIRLRENLNSFQFIHALFLQAVLQTFFY